MPLRLNHIGIVVHDIAEVARILAALGMKSLTGPEPDPIQKVTACFFASEGHQGVHLELLQPTDETSPVANFLRKRGGGLHHLCFEVDDIDSIASVLQARGHRLVSPPVQCLGYDRSFGLGAKRPTRIAFLMTSNKLLIELLQKGQ